MNRLERPVDRAIAEDRPEKDFVRSLWVDEVRAAAQQSSASGEPLYLTLPGAEGRDIQLLINEGLIALTEVNSIVEEDLGKIVAVENNNQAIAALQRKFIGLRIKEVPFQNLIRGEEQFSWPEGEDEVICRAKVINLDLNTPFRAQRRDGDVVFPVLAWIRKLCQIHAKHPCIDWTLCLTLHGEVVWPENVSRYTRDFLCENLDREALFADGCKEFLGEVLFQLTTRDDGPCFTDLDRSDQQKLIMVMVPKIIVRLVHNEGWRVRTERNLRYGGGERAPMVTWIVKFTWDDNAIARPDTVYREALRDILSGAGLVTENGEIL